MQLAQDYETIPIDAVEMHPANPRRGDLDAITSSITANGFFGACVVQRSTKFILIGNHRWLAAREAGEQSIPVLWVDVDDEQARRIMVADNRTAELATWDAESLSTLLTELAGTDAGLEGVGFTDDDLQQLVESLNEPERDPTVLPNANVLIADPHHEVRIGEVYQLGPHVLVVDKVTLGWPLWSQYLTEGMVFCPHPSPYLPLSHAVEYGNLLMVTSSTYLAGHVLDKWESSGGDIRLQVAAP